MKQLAIALALTGSAVLGSVVASTPANALETPDASLRLAGVVSAVIGVLIVWVVRG